MKKNGQLRAVLFDMDGVLLDSELYIREAGIRLFREKGHEVQATDFLPFTGMGEDRFLGGVAEKHGIPFNLERDKARCYEIYASLVSGKLAPLEGTVAFIEKCRSAGLKCAVASSADRIKVDINLRETGLECYRFDAIVSGKDVVNKKPAPDVFIRAAQLCGEKPRHCLVIEDAISGVEAGKRAGAKVLALTSSFSAGELAKADWICEHLASAPPEVLNW